MAIKDNSQTIIKSAICSDYFPMLKKIALLHGYKLLIHDTLNGYLDLVAIPWDENIKHYQKLIEEMVKCLGGYLDDKESFPKKEIKPHDRKCFVINYGKDQYVYISVTQSLDKISFTSEKLTEEQIIKFQKNWESTMTGFV